MPGGTTRRQFLVRGGALAGALSVGAGAALLPARGGAQASALTAARLGTYTALMEAVVTAPALRLDASVAPGVAAEFAAAYARWPAERRRRADTVLDALERAPAGASFSALDSDRRGAELRADGRATRASPTGTEQERLDLTAGALELAAVALGPTDEGHQIVTV